MTTVIIKEVSILIQICLMFALATHEKAVYLLIVSTCVSFLVVLVQVLDFLTSGVRALLKLCGYNK